MLYDENIFRCRENVWRLGDKYPLSSCWGWCRNRTSARVCVLQRKPICHIIWQIRDLLMDPVQYWIKVQKYGLDQINICPGPELGQDWLKEGTIYTPNTDLRKNEWVLCPGFQHPGGLPHLRPQEQGHAIYPCYLFANFFVALFKGTFF